MVTPPTRSIISPEAGQVDRRVVVDRRADEEADLLDQRVLRGLSSKSSGWLRTQVMNELILPVKVRPSYSGKSEMSRGMLMSTTSAVVRVDARDEERVGQGRRPLLGRVDPGQQDVDARRRGRRAWRSARRRTHRPAGRWLPGPIDAEGSHGLLRRDLDDEDPRRGVVERPGRIADAAVDEHDEGRQDAEGDERRAVAERIA